MKRSMILIPAFLFLAQISKAQTGKGNQTLGVNLGFEYYTQTGVSIDPVDNTLSAQTNKITSFSFGPSYSYFLADNLDLGATFNYTYSKNNYGPNSYTTEYNNKDYGATVFLRKYILYKNKIGFRVGPFLGYSINDQKTIFNAQYNAQNTDSKSNTYEAGAELEFVYYPTKHLGLSVTLANLNYDHTKINNGTEGFENADQVNFNFINNNLAVSLLYVFGGK